ncbi:unnamed protein product [Rhizoctonia solani]|uniref:Uncharacterized protein n=1 Tax=Rhizoctonia solani TaxID=456999 RepID=A0A8H3GFM5_9AGAM|nr:unnamed protein product [Rhizoctonia solani]
MMPIVWMIAKKPKGKHERPVEHPRGLRIFWSWSSGQLFGIFRSVGDIEWCECVETDNPRAECGGIIAPLDYFGPSAGAVTVALAKYKADPELRRVPYLLIPVVLAHRKRYCGIQPLQYVGSAVAHGHFGGLRHITEQVLGTTYVNFGIDGIRQLSVYEIGNSGKSVHVTLRSTLAEVFQPLSWGQQRQAMAPFDAQAKLCAKNMPNGGIDMKYMGTSPVARNINSMATVPDGPGAPI